MASDTLRAGTGLWHAGIWAGSFPPGPYPSHHSVFYVAVSCHQRRKEKPHVIWINIRWPFTPRTQSSPAVFTFHLCWLTPSPPGTSPSTLFLSCWAGTCNRERQVDIDLPALLVITWNSKLARNSPSLSVFKWWLNSTNWARDWKRIKKIVKQKKKKKDKRLKQKSSPQFKVFFSPVLSLMKNRRRWGEETEVLCAPPDLLCRYELSICALTHPLWSPQEFLPDLREFWLAFSPIQTHLVSGTF